MTRLILIAAFLAGALAALSVSAPRAQGCAFSQAPNTYEATRDRTAYLVGEELAAFNMIDSDDPFFGIPREETGVRGERTLVDQPYVPPTLLKATGWIESALQQAATSVPWGSTGPALVSFDCGHGIMQITSGMTSPQDGSYPSQRQALVATHFLYNIGRGAAILVDKWNGAPEVRPIAGTDTGGDPSIIENWYFAVWSYNGFTGPGANRSNHPMDPDYEWPRTGFSCGPADDGFGHSYGDYPYQELVFGCATRPPSVDGVQLWDPQRVSLPDLDDADWSGPLSLENFTTSDWYARMDMQTPQPLHHDHTAQPGESAAGLLRGAPQLVASRSSVDDDETDVQISNGGTGILPWRATTSASWITVDKQGGVALQQDVTCAPNATCERVATVRITLHRDRAPPGETGWVDLQNLVTGEVWQVHIDAEPPANPGDANCDGTVTPVDATDVLQYDVRLALSLPCLSNADVNTRDGVNGIDALLILQYSAGLIASLPAAPTP